MKTNLKKTCYLFVAIMLLLVSFQPFSVHARVSGEEAALTINVWYGNNQSFGSIGQPQGQVNILGNVSGSVSSIAYSLNGGPQIPIRIGPDGRRLAKAGDFNIELYDAVFNNGGNTLTVYATDTLSDTTSIPLTVQYNRSNKWPLPTTVNWSASEPLNNQAQIVDGKWAVEDGKIRPLEMGYDRLVGVGDISWKDYQVTVPITVNALDESGYNEISTNPGFGLLLRWTGHTDIPVSTDQPNSGWLPFGALAWYSYEKDLGGNLVPKLKLSPHREDPIDYALSPAISFGVTYIFKAQVVTNPDQSPHYRFKVWQQGTAEPAGWMLEKDGAVGDPRSGSILLFAHHTDVSFGSVSVSPLGSAPVPSSIISDDFNRCQLDTSLWTFVNPKGDATASVTGGFTPNAFLNISIPYGVSHDILPDSIQAPRIMQPANDTDFSVIAKFESPVNQQYQMQGILVQQDETRFLRFEVHSVVTGAKFYSASYVPGEEITRSDALIAASVPVPFYLKVERKGERWIGWYSTNSTTWTAYASFPEDIAISSIGLFAGNAVGASSPSHTALVDYFFNVDSPISSEDNGQNTLAVNINPVAGGTVGINPVKSVYSCGEQVTLTAKGNPGYYFLNWSGWMSGSTNPAIITMNGSKVVTANFAEGQQIGLFLPVTLK